MGLARGAVQVHLYLGVWAGYFVLLVLLPVRYGALQEFLAAGSLILWVGLSALAAYATSALFGRRQFSLSAAAQSARRPLDSRDLNRIVLIGLGMGAVGFVALAFDRIVIQGVDFTQGIAVARQLWQQGGEEREGVSSVFSVIGYLVGFGFFVSTTFAHLHWERLTKRMRLVVIIGASFLVVANSFLAGGRSVVLIQLACIVATGGLRALLGLRMFPGRSSRTLLGIALTSILAMSYAIYVFSERAEAGGTMPERYAHEMLRYLGGEPTEQFFSLGDLPFFTASTAQFGTVAGAYLTHSFGTFESVLEIRATPGDVSFGFIRELLVKLGVVDAASDEWILGGRFLSLPGSLWYDFGWLGFYLGALVLGCLLGSVPAIVAIVGGGGLSVCAALVLLITGLLAPLLLAIDIMCVPFLITGFVIVDTAHRMWFGPTSWFFVGRPVRDARFEMFS